MRIDYSRHAAEYDRTRADERLDREFWLRAIVEVGGLRRNDRILDLGAGTGRFAKLLSETNAVVALDASPEMLGVGRRKGPFESVLADAHQLPFRAGAFDATVLMMVLHHFADFPATLREVARVSRTAVIATTNMATRELGVLEEAFPSLRSIDQARFPAIDRIDQALRAAGFRKVRIEERPYRRVLTVDEQLERVRRRYLSTFDLLPAGEYERGVRFLEQELPRRYGNRFEANASFTFLASTM